MADYNLKIEMVDLKGQYQKIKSEIDNAMIACVESAEFINGKLVALFSENLAKYVGVKHVIPCANGTDALQIALMALDLKPGDEVIVPAFTYVATAEVIALLNLVPVMVDVMPDDFSINLEEVKKSITSKTKAIVPVHLFGQCAGMEELLLLAKENNIYVVEDTAQAIGAKYIFKDGSIHQAGTMGHIGTTSFFPSKNLGCYGDGGAIFTNNDALANRLKMMANHGQSKKYQHDEVGVNSRLDTLQAAILDIKLKHLDKYCAARNSVAEYYDNALKNIPGIIIPKRVSNSTHVFHQYTMKIENNKRDELKSFLLDKGIPSMVYYPFPLHFQKAYQSDRFPKGSLPISENLCEEVLSLPIHTEMTIEMQNYITNTIIDFFKK
jgi:UDP-2-acetamido-2-deoxy-ribo-hexuluronate aminotransferase